MAFIAKNPIVAPETNFPPVPPQNTRGIFPKDDGWYEIDDKGNITKLGSQDSASEYYTLDLGEAHSGQAGIIKHEITAGTPKNLGSATAPNGIITLDRTSPFPKAVGTSGTLKSSGGLKIKVDELFSFGDEAEINCESYAVKKFSDDVVLLSSWLYSYTRIAANVNGGFWEFRIPISALNEMPAVTTPDSVAVLLNSAFEVKSESTIRAMTTFAWNSFAISFSYDDNNDYATVLVAQRYPYTTITEARRAVDKSQLSIKYLLKDFVYKYNTDKLYLNQEESVNYEPDSDSADYKTLILKAPKNNRASLDMLEPVTENINALNYRVENIKITSISNGIGKGDGLTDDTAALQNAINAAKTSSGALKAVTIPAGKYLISSPLVLDSSNFTLKGDGEVILEAADKSYRKPIIIVKAHDVTIENITIHLGYCDDDPQFTKGYNKLTDNDSDINNDPSEGLHCGIWLDTANTYNHITENESLNPYLGYYRTKIKDCRIIGGYRYSVKKLERSYGIYMPDNGFQYFSNLQDIELFNLYCGIRLGDKSSSLKVDFHFDHDINGRGGANSTNCGGCRFGLINYGNYTHITCMGQLMGGDFMPPIYYDNNGNEHLMNDSEKVTKPLYDSATLEQTSVTTADGWQDYIMEYRKLSEIGMVIFGSNNRIHSMIFDVQRSDKGIIYFGINSGYNDLFLVSGVQSNLYGANETTYYGESYYRPVTVNGVNYFDIVKYDVHQPAITDLGIHNHRSENPIENRTLPFIGDCGVYARDDNGNASKIFATSFGMQDNFLSFVDKWGQVKVTQGDNEINAFTTINNSGNEIQTDNIGYVFDTNSNLLQGFSTGVTFNEIPTESSPIVIDINFGGTFAAPTAGFIQFNKFIAKKFSVCLVNGAGTEMLECNVSDNHNAIAYYKPYNITNGSRIENSGCRGMRIKIFEGLAWNNADSDGVSNPDGKVGISYIYMSNSNAGGMSYLPREGGKTTTLDENSTDTQYPSAKATYDELVKKANTTDLGLQFVNLGYLSETADFDKLDITYNCYGCFRIRSDIWLNARLNASVSGDFKQGYNGNILVDTLAPNITVYFIVRQGNTITKGAGSSETTSTQIFYSGDIYLRRITEERGRSIEFEW